MRDRDEAMPRDEAKSTDIDEYIQRQEFLNTNFRRVIASGARSKEDGKSMKEKMGPLCTHKCPQLHLEFPLKAGWPNGVDRDFAYKVLYRASLGASSHPWLMSYMIQSGSFFLTPDQEAKRWHGLMNLTILLSQDS
jgi:hypothetical protein